ncbi:transposase [Candidatus Peregrinibacteria bacterium]|nr:transposase [Candidatus Peregrinibacteria bacterium]
MTQRHFSQNEQKMFITTVTKDRRPIFANPALAREAVECLYRVQELHPFFLYAFVIMPDHCHFLVTVPEPGTISKIMNVYKSGMTFNTGIRRMWQARFHMRIVRNANGAFRYIHWNPVKAGLCENMEDYPWSSACGKWDVSEWEIL